MSEAGRRLVELRDRRADFVAMRDEFRTRLQLLEDAWIDALLDDRTAGREAIDEARAQLARAEADVAMVDRVLDRWQLVH